MQSPRSKCEMYGSTLVWHVQTPEGLGGFVRWRFGVKQDAEAALWLANHDPVWTAQLIRQSPYRGVVLLLDREKSVIGRSELTRSDHRCTRKSLGCTVTEHVQMM
jgi:hypothetical protein